MKKYFYLTIIFLNFFFTINSISQDIIEKKFFDYEKKLGGEVTLKSSIIREDGINTYKIFEFESPESDYYYLSAWIMGGEYTNFGSGKFLEYDLFVNGEKQVDRILTEKNNWHNVNYKDYKTKEKKKVKLNKGLNHIIFVGNAPDIPEVEFIRLSKEEDKSEISENSYNQYIDDIKNEIQERINNPKPKRDTNIIQNRSGQILDNPSGNYYHKVNINLYYTTYKFVSFSTGQVFITTYASDGYEHVLEVFKDSNPEAYSWVNLSNANGLASLNINITSPGLYVIRIRAFSQETQGLVDLNVNGQNYYSNCPVSGSGIRNEHETPTTYNYFTCFLTGDSRIWIEDDSSFPGKIRAHNDDYFGGGDFLWGLSSRVKKDFNVRIASALISSYSAYSPTGKCDLYMVCQNSNIMSYFTNLKADDAIQSAPPSTVYRCISWSGGITTDYFWPPDPFDPYNAGTALASFDNFYGSNRYGGAMLYSRTGANSSNSVVDLWYNPNFYNVGIGDYTHASVRRPGNHHPHGYDWESKPGTLMRTMHPRNSLNSLSVGGYGNINNYYKNTTDPIYAMLLIESIAKGKSVIENVEFTENEKDLISNLIYRIPYSQRLELNDKFEAWKQTWGNPEQNLQSNPRFYAQSKEYNEFIGYCKYLGKISWPFIYDKFNKYDFYLISALEDLTLKENMDVLQKIKDDNESNKISSSGAYIVRSLRINAIKYIKALLGSTEKGIKYSNSFDFTVFPNPVNSESEIAFNLPYEAQVKVEIIELEGKVICVPLSKQLLTKGFYKYKLNIPSTYRGVCLVVLMIDSNVNVKQIIVE